MQQFLPMLDAGLIYLDNYVQVEGETSVHMAENEMYSEKSNLEGYAKADEEVEASFQATMEIKNVKIDISPNEASELQSGQDVFG